MTDDGLYHHKLLELARLARRHSSIDKVTHWAEATNPVCGDRIRIDFQVDSEKSDEDGVIAAMALHIDSCAICEAASGILLTAAVGGQASEVLAMHQVIEKWLEDGAAHTPPPMMGLEVLLPVKMTYRNRVKCALLPFVAARKALDKDKTPSEKSSRIKHA